MVGYADALGLRPQGGVALMTSPAALEAERAAAARAGAAPGVQQSQQASLSEAIGSIAPGQPETSAGSAGFNGGAAAGGGGGGAGGGGSIDYGTGSSGGPLSESAQASLLQGAQELGMDPRDLATIIAYETGGRFDPNIRGGMNKDGSGKGSFMGLIQFDPANQRRYGLRPGMTFEQQMPAVVRYFRERGYKPGMDLAHAYAIVNHGSLNPDGSIRNISDVNGSVYDHVSRMRQGHGARARGAVPMAFGGGGWNGAMGIAPPGVWGSETTPTFGALPSSSTEPAPLPGPRRPAAPPNIPANTYSSALLGELPTTKASLYPKELV